MSLVRGNLPLALLATAAFALSGCTQTGTNTQDTLDVGDQASLQENTVPDRSGDLRAFCPKTQIRDGTEVYRTYEDGITRDTPGALNSVRFQATVTQVARECNYTPTSLGMKIGIKGRVINGPTGATGTINVPIRVAVASVDKTVLYSKLHQVPVSIPEGGTFASFSFVDDQVQLPVPERNNLVVFVGFDEGPPSGPVAANQ